MVNMDAIRAYLAATFPTLPSEINDYVSSILENNVNKLLTLEDVVEAVGAHIQSYAQESCNGGLNRTCLQLLRLLHGENFPKVEKDRVTTKKLDHGVDVAAQNHSSAGMGSVWKVQAMDVPTTANKEELGKVGVRAEQKIEQRITEAVAQTKGLRSSATSSQIWLQERQEERRTSFYTRSSVKSKGIIRLRCNRAGKYTKSTETRVTHSKRDVLHCSCFMDVKLEEDGRVNVKGCFGHIGHKVEVALLRLTPSQQNFLRGLLEEFSHEYIIKRLRRDYPTSRLGCVNKSDLWSIVNKYGLRPGCRHKDDMQSLKKREEESNPNDGIRWFEMPENPTGKGFCMVEVDGAQVRKEERSHLRDSINMKLAVLHSKVNALVNTDTDEAKETLSTIEALIDRASKTAQITTAGIAIRPELTKRGAKPKQSKVQLYTDGDELPEVPSSGLSEGILPCEIRGLVERRRQVKKLMKEEALEAKRKQIKRHVNQCHRLLELELDGVFKRMLLLKKKKYAALSVNPDNELDTKKELKGLDIERQIGLNWRKTLEKIHESLQRLRARLDEGVDTKLFEISKQLTRSPKDYHDLKSQPHAAVAGRLNETGKFSLRQGDIVEYIICEDGTNNSAMQRAYHRTELESNPELKIGKLL
ncbi:DNA polymerase family B [Teladorsagia circumcincta]|uniref:DNA-directed DNA polymerase n=1 Tax=Teladorsagia circumcincta TaxID=45464 RepID=A0A2G9U169_TELCI|nr:DNA polymerase family B [Teladorsagia circumcincta]